MTPRHRETVSYTQPVRFYKAVALTFLCFTLILLGFIIFMSAKRATIIIETKATAVDVSGTLEIGGDADATLSGMSASSTIATIEEVFGPSAGREEDGVATGIVTIHNETDTAQALIPTTRLLPPQGVLFRLKNRVEIPARGAAAADVYADAKGGASNIGPTRFTIPGLSEERQKVIYANSEGSMTGGVRTVGIFGAEDKKIAEARIMQKLLDEGKKHFSKITEDQGIAVHILQYAVSFDKEVGDEAGEIRGIGRGTIVGVIYPKDLLKQHAMAILEKRTIDEREVIEPRTEDPTVSIEEYDPATGRTVIKVFYDGIASLNPESNSVDTSIFFGKTKDEVRRYVLSLDHVQGVQVDFSPLWVTRVPYSADHVQVIIKSVE